MGWDMDCVFGGVLYLPTTSGGVIWFDLLEWTTVISPPRCDTIFFIFIPFESFSERESNRIYVLKTTIIPLP